jgi:hypothetical protein
MATAPEPSKSTCVCKPSCEIVAWPGGQALLANIGVKTPSARTWRVPGRGHGVTVVALSTAAKGLHDSMSQVLIVGRPIWSRPARALRSLIGFAPGTGRRRIDQSVADS